MIDTRGMSCPQPVLMSKNAIKSNPASVEILVDNNTAKENVRRFLVSSGYKVDITESGEDFILKGAK
jgi:TusA-related sulfurtransferase